MILKISLALASCRSMIVEIWHARLHRRSSKFYYYKSTCHSNSNFLNVVDGPIFKCSKSPGIMNRLCVKTNLYYNRYVMVELSFVV